MAIQTKASIVFAHGIWADGSCFQKLIPTLRAEGHDVMAAQYGLDTLKGDVDATIRTFGRVSGPIVLVGHSYGGTVITHAGMDPRVAALVYIAAVAPDETETSQSQQEKFTKTDVFKNIDVADGRVWLKPGSGVPCFAGDLSAEEQGVVYATHFAPNVDLFDQKLDGIAWRSKPSWYIVATDDRAVSPDLLEAHGRHDRRAEEQPCPDAVATARSARCDSQRFCCGRRKARMSGLEQSNLPAGRRPQRVRVGEARLA